MFYQNRICQRLNSLEMMIHLDENPNNHLDQRESPTTLHSKKKASKQTTLLVVV